MFLDFELNWAEVKKEEDFKYLGSTLQRIKEIFKVAVKINLKKEFPRWTEERCECGFFDCGGSRGYEEKEADDLLWWALKGAADEPNKASNFTKSCYFAVFSHYIM